MNKPNILIVENETVVAEDIQESLEVYGYKISGTVSSGEGAVRKVSEKRPDLVLMDIRLTGKLDGIQAAKKIRDRFSIPVVYLTSHADEETLQRAKITKPFGYILKPFQGKELHTAIEVALYSNKIEGELKESMAWLATVLKSISDAVIAVDNRGFITFMNPVAEELTGCKKNDALGKDLTKLFKVIDEESGMPVENPVKEALGNSRKESIENNTTLVTVDEEELSIDYSLAPIKNNGAVAGMVLVFRDVTERKRAEIELKKKIDELEKFYKVAVGRELKMIELKKKAKRLEKRLQKLEQQLRMRSGLNVRG